MNQGIQVRLGSGGIEVSVITNPDEGYWGITLRPLPEPHEVGEALEFGEHEMSESLEIGEVQIVCENLESARVLQDQVNEVVRRFVLAKAKEEMA